MKIKVENVAESAKILTNVQDFGTFSNILNFYFLIVVTSATQHTKFLTSFILLKNFMAYQY